MELDVLAQVEAPDGRLDALPRGRERRLEFQVAVQTDKRLINMPEELGVDGRVEGVRVHRRDVALTRPPQCLRIDGVRRKHRQRCEKEPLYSATTSRPPSPTQDALTGEIELTNNWIQLTSDWSRDGNCARRSTLGRHRFCGPRSLPDFAYEHLRQAILSRRLPSGAPLRQEKIAEQLGVSRLPVREALRRLHVEGLVDLQPRRGYFVASFNRDEIEELFDIRGTLEAKAGFYATQRRTRARRRRCRADCSRMLDETAAQTPTNVLQFFQQNQAFHNRLFESSGRKQLCRMVQIASNSLEPYVRMSASLDSLESTQRDHHAIFNAFRDGHAEEVAALQPPALRSRSAGN